jgi:hypothetical protein
MAQPYQRTPDGMRLQFGGINVVLPPDQMPAGKYPFGQNVRAYLRDRVTGRATQDQPVETLPYPVHSLRRLNDLTPAGPPLGFILVAGAGVLLWANQTAVDSGLSGNPISLVPFRPAASVQPWMYVGDSVKMDKVRSDGLCYAMGIAEPQVAPTVTFTPASTILSTVGPITVTYWGDSPHSGPTGNYIWKNAADGGGSGPVRLSKPPNGVTTGSSLLFDTTPGNQQNPMLWSVFLTFNGVVNTSGTSVTWVSGDQFNFSAGFSVTINGVAYTIAASPAPTNTTLALTTSAGTQTGVAYEAAAISGTNALFQPALESEGYSDFNFCLEATLYVPAAGTYTLSLQSKDDVMWGIGGTATGTATWPGPTGGQQRSSAGQKLSAKNGYPLLPRTATNDGGGLTVTASIAVTFSAAGNYPLEVDYDYWYHSGRTLQIKANGLNIPPIPSSAITEAQYRYTYRSSATGATSNPSPASTEQSLSVLANQVTATVSTDPQVDKIDFYRLDTGLLNYTYVGTVPNGTVRAFLIDGVFSTGPQGPRIGPVADVIPLPEIGQQLSVDSGANQETITVLSVGFSGGGLVFVNIGAVFTKTHAINTPIISAIPVLDDTLLDADVAANPLLEFDNFQPFPSIDLPKSGVVNVSGGVATWVAGDKFNIRWLPGTVIIIGTVAYTLDKRPTSTTTLTATNTEIVGGISTVVPIASGTGLSYNIAEPILAAQPLPYMWGPTDNVNFAFAVGDPLRPGTLYWSKGNNLDSAPDTNQQDVTSPSEPLQNGCIVGGLGWVASAERAWLIYPNFFNAQATVEGTVGSTWTLQESSLKRGLYMPRCLAVDGGDNVYFRAKDGIYVSPGGSGGQSITDGDLYNLFPHEGVVPTPVVRGGFAIYPPDDTLPQQQKLNFATGYIYYDYVGTNGLHQTLVYDTIAKGWVMDVYQYPASVHVLEEGPNVNGVLLGCQDGGVRPLTDSGAENATSVILMPSYNAGDARAQKHWADLYIEGE